MSYGESERADQADSVVVDHTSRYHHLTEPVVWDDWEMFRKYCFGTYSAEMQASNSQERSDCKQNEEYLLKYPCQYTVSRFRSAIRVIVTFFLVSLAVYPAFALLGGYLLPPDALLTILPMVGTILGGVVGTPCSSLVRDPSVNSDDSMSHNTVCSSSACQLICCMT